MRWNQRQRVVLVVAMGLGLFVLWNWVQAGGWRRDHDGGWFNYAPNNGVVFQGSHPTNATLRLVVQVTFILVWAIPSIWILRARAQQPDATAASPDQIAEDS